MLILAGQSLKEVLLSPNFLQISETQTFTVHSQERIEQKYGLYMGHFLQGGNFSCFEPFSVNKKAYRTRDPICCFWLSHFVDSGPPFVDSGTHFVDSGTHLVDSGRQNGDCHSEKTQNIHIVDLGF